MVFLGVQIRSVRVVLAEGLCELGRITSAEGLRDGEAGRATYLIMPWHSLYNWGKARETSVRTAEQPGDCSLRRIGCLCGTASAGLLDVRSPRFPRWLQPALSPRRCLRSCRTKGFPASVNFDSKLSVNALMWSANNGIPKSSWICLLQTYQGALVAMRRHLDCSTCSFLTWMLAANLQIGHA
jgi:hypothetical protein